MKKALIINLMFFLSFWQGSQAICAERSWTGSGDGSDWHDEENWSPQSVPTPEDDVRINSNSAAVRTAQTFQAKSITLGGTVPSSFTVEQIISGAVEPAANTDLAFYNRRHGLTVLRGSAGTVELKGTYKDSEAELANQPSLVFFVE